MAARASRPRKTDCDPSTDVNLCAFEREYSIEAARHPEHVMDVRACGPSVAMLRIAERIDLRLTDGPLHTRPFPVSGIEASEFYRTLSPDCKSVWTLVRQLRGPHFSTCA